MVNRKVKSISCSLLYDEDELWDGKIIVDENNNFEGIVVANELSYIYGKIDENNMSFSLLNNHCSESYSVDYVKEVGFKASHIGIFKNNITNEVKRCNILIEKMYLNDLDYKDLTNILDISKKRVKSELK